MNDSLLQQLPDIDLPAPIGIWPLAPGWYAVIALVVIFLIMIACYLIQRARRLRPRKLILQKLADLQQRYARESDAVAFAAEISALLRKATLIAFPRREVAGLQGQQWLDFLDATGKTTQFSQGVGRVLITAPYQQYAEYPVTELIALVTAWVSANVLRK
ncbi:MAG: DUF4381 domain-containing protein [Pseudomonadota bacterium]|nr:DUF4381 domain-containing protein [Pseudomonadota bacterium]